MSEAAAPRRAAIAFIFVTVMLDMLAVGLVVPVMPKLVLEMVGSNSGSAARIIGYFGFFWSLMQFFFAPILGALSDRFGRRRVILLSNFGLGFNYIFTAWAPTLGWLFIGRLISGIAAASITTAGAYIADVTPPEKRAAGFGMLGAAFGVGFIIGPVLGGLLGHINPRLPFWVAAGFSLTNGLYGTFVLPESLARDKRSPFRWAKANPVASFELLRSNTSLLGLATCHFLYNVAHQVLPAIFVLYADYRYHLSTKSIGYTFAAVGVGSMIVQGGLVKPVVAKLGERRTLIIGLLCGTLAFTVMGLAGTSIQFWMALPLMALWGFASPSAQGLMTQKLLPTEQGRLQGALQGLTAITGMIGPIIFTQVFAFFISSRTPVHAPGAPFLMAGLFIFLALIVGAQVTRAPTGAVAA